MHSGPNDAARFLQADSEELVAAAFACPTCLRADGRVHLGADVADCVCPRCERRWDVALDIFQSLRLTLAPPKLEA